jgi:hypothetical protein
VALLLVLCIAIGAWTSLSAEFDSPDMALGHSTRRTISAVRGGGFAMLSRLQSKSRILFATYGVTYGARGFGLVTARSAIARLHFRHTHVLSARTAGRSPPLFV